MYVYNIYIYICIYIYIIYICVYMYIYVFIYIYRDRQESQLLKPLATSSMQSSCHRHNKKQIEETELFLF